MKKIITASGLLVFIIALLLAAVLLIIKYSNPEMTSTQLSIYFWREWLSCLVLWIISVGSYTIIKSRS